MIPLLAPRFWFRQRSWAACALRPLSWLWRLVARMKYKAAKPYRSKLPVICVGNVTVGGAGKTPLCIALCRALQTEGITGKPCFLTRGYGGKTGHATVVDNTNTDAAKLYGDEALELARCAPVIVARDRAAGLQLAEQQGYDLVIVDDGFQNGSFVKDISILAFDGTTGIGNGLCLPAGPCREPLENALPRADAALITGADETNLRPRLSALPVFGGRIKAPHDKGDGKFLAFAGIGRPEKFFDTLRRNGFELVETKSFPDHHPYTEDEIKKLIDNATRLEAKPITTEKDFMRIPLPLKKEVEILPVSLEIDDMATLLTLIRAKVSTA